MQDLFLQLLSEKYIVSQAEITTDEAYIITDCKDGINYALTQKVGYIFYETSDNKELDYSSCQCVITNFDGITSDFILKMYQRFKNIPWTIATTNRLIIRELEISDIKRFYEIYEDLSIKKYCQPLNLDPQQEMEFQLAYIETMYKLLGYGIWNIIRKSDNKIIGRAGITYRDGYDSLELGYLIDKKERNKGYAYESCKAIMEYSKNELDCHNLNIFVHDENVESINLAKKLGFEYCEECTINDKLHLRYSINL